MIDKKSLSYAWQHRKDDAAKLLLSAKGVPNSSLVAQQIEGWQRATSKWQWLSEYPDIVYPPRLNCEQSSSQEAALYKSRIIKDVTTMADLTGGMGIDTLMFSQMAQQCYYVEKNADLCEMMSHNKCVLGADNITVINDDSISWLGATDIVFDLLYIDPSRRDSNGERVIALNDCYPDVIANLSLLLKKGRRILIKCSPMVDISMVMRKLDCVSQVHIVAVGGECKEVLLLIDTEQQVVEPSFFCINLRNRGCDRHIFLPSQEQEESVVYAKEIGQYLYFPHAALMKGGCFRLLCRWYDMQCLSANTHIYTANQLHDDFPGRIFRIEKEIVHGGKEIHEFLKEGKAHAIVRNYPCTAAQLLRQLHLKEGGERFIIATTIQGKKALFIASLVRSDIQ